MWLLVALALGVVLAWCWPATSAHADGDPASDVLATQSLFLPQDAGIPADRQGQLQRLVQEAAGSGVPIRVAVIAAPTDLGSITELWRQPADYARFLGQELSLVYHGVLLVVMPNGYGVFHAGHSVAAAQTALKGLPAPGSGSGLANATIQATRALASAAGHPLTLPQATGRASGGSSDPVPWIVFGLGLGLTGLAWAASLRARPLGSGRPDAPSA